MALLKRDKIITFFIIWRKCYDNNSNKTQNKTKIKIKATSIQDFIVRENPKLTMRL